MALTNGGQTTVFKTTGVEDDSTFDMSNTCFFNEPFVHAAKVFFRLHSMRVWLGCFQLSHDHTIAFAVAVSLHRLYVDWSLCFILERHISSCESFAKLPFGLHYKFFFILSDRGSHKGGPSAKWFSALQIIITSESFVTEPTPFRRNTLIFSVEPCYHNYIIGNTIVLPHT